MPAGSLFQLHSIAVHRGASAARLTARCSIHGSHACRHEQVEDKAGGICSEWHLIDISDTEHLAITAKFTPGYNGACSKWDYVITPEIQPMLPEDKRKLPAGYHDVKLLLQRIILRSQPITEDDDDVINDGSAPVDIGVPSVNAKGVKRSREEGQEHGGSAAAVKPEGPLIGRKDGPLLSKRNISRIQRKNLNDAIPQAEFDALLKKIVTRKECMYVPRVSF